MSTHTYGFLNKEQAVIKSISGNHIKARVVEACIAVCNNSLSPFF